jgi:hypothetical protein
MSRRPTTHRCVLRRPTSTSTPSGLTPIPGPMLALSREQMVTAAVFEHEARYGDCDTESAHRQGDQQIRQLTDRAWDELMADVRRRYAHGRSN